MKKARKFKQKIMLDIGGGENPQKGYICMDKRDLPTVDIVHDAEDIPYPLKDGSCSVIMMSHLIEHIKPWLTISVMDECWRLLEKDGWLLICTPYATSFGFYQDPTHCNPWNEATPAYFDPTHESGLYSIYKPKPWKIEKLYWDLVGNMEIAFEKVKDDKAKKRS